MRGTFLTTIVCATAILSAFALVATPRPRQKLNDPSNQSLSIRDPGTVSTFLYKRWIWAWLGAELLWKGLSVATTIWGAGCTIAGVTKSLSTGGKIACAVGAAIGALASISTFIIGNIGLSAAETAYVTGQSFLELTRRYDEDTNSTDLTPRVRNIIQGYRRNRFHHSHDDSLVLNHHILNATSDNPLHVYGAGTHMMAWNFTLWAEANPITNRTTMISKFVHPSGETSEKTKRQSSCISIGANAEDCPEGYDSTPGDPTEWITGVDIYGNFNDDDTWITGMGTDNENDSNFLNLAEGVGEQVNGGNYWDSCLCGKGNNDWIFTGSMQATWNGAYNGYSQCWNSNCDGA